MQSNTNAHIVSVLESSEVFEEIDGVYRFTKTAVICLAESKLYHAHISARALPSCGINFKDLENVTPIPKTAFQPRYKASTTQCLTSTAEDCFIKRPSLICHDNVSKSSNPNRIADRLQQEIDVYEFLKQHPHPNIVHYLGCEVEDGLSTGICLTNYPETLMKRVNPQSRMKRAFRYDSRTLSDRDRVLSGVRSAICHLHALGLVHNDLNPSNIMLLSDDTPIIIDFDSCRCIGHNLNGAGRTYEWHDEKVQSSVPQNDLDALAEISEWLTDKEQKDFQFDE